MTTSPPQYEFESTQEAHEIRLLDEKRLRQVLLNLLSNAIKFTKQGHVIFRLTRSNALDHTFPA